MGASGMMERIAATPPRFKARIAGLFYLLTFLTGVFALFIRGRLGLVVGLIAGACYIAVMLLFYDIFKEVSTLRLYVMRSLYLLNFVGLGFAIWPEVIKQAGNIAGTAHRIMGAELLYRGGAWDPLQAVAISFWAALSALSGLGLQYPLRMVPLLLLQLFYKLVWLTAVALPLWSAGQSTGFTKTFVVGAVLDLIVIPWPYVLANYMTGRGDRWR